MSSRVALRHKAYWLLAALLVLVLALATIPATSTFQGTSWAAEALLVAGPLSAGMSGALIRSVFDESGEQLRAAVAGAAAGGLSGVLFVAAQLLTNPGALKGDSITRLIFFVVAVGFAAGLAFDAVLAKLRGIDVTQTSPIDVVAKDPPP
jgi:drug/metabolite transporter (DMT)-like permease